MDKNLLNDLANDIILSKHFNKKIYINILSIKLDLLNSKRFYYFNVNIFCNNNFYKNIDLYELLKNNFRMFKGLSTIRLDYNLENNNNSSFEYIKHHIKKELSWLEIPDNLLIFSDLSKLN